MTAIAIEKMMWTKEGECVGKPEKLENVLSLSEQPIEFFKNMDLTQNDFCHSLILN